MGVNRWIFESEDEAKQFTVFIRTDGLRYVDDIDVTTLSRVKPVIVDELLRLLVDLRGPKDAALETEPQASAPQ